jgi:hypothetical protein
VRICCNEDAYCPIFRLHFQDRELQLEVEPNAIWEWEPSGVTKIAGRA